MTGTNARSHRDGGRGVTPSHHPGSLGTKAKAQHCTKSLEQPLNPYPSSSGTKAKGQHCTATCWPCHAEGTILQPCKPKSYFSLLLSGI